MIQLFIRRNICETNLLSRQFIDLSDIPSKKQYQRWIIIELDWPPDGDEIG